MVKVMKYSSILTLIGIFQLQLHWLELGACTSQLQFTHLTQLRCDNIPVCAISQPNQSFSVVSKIQCVLYCQNPRQQPGNCLGVNYHEQKKTCDVFYYEATNYTKNVVGCQYIQKGSVDNLKSAQIFPCDSSPCMNNGTCVENDIAYNCFCVSGLNGSIAGFEGTRCEIIVSNIINLSGSYNYVRVPGVQLTNKSAVLVYGKISTDFHVALTAAPDNYTANTMYEIVISGWTNSQSIIRKAKQGNNLATASTVGYLSATSYRPFWLTWKNGTITVGQNTTIGSRAFMDFNDTTPSTVNYIALSGLNSVGSGFVKVIP